MMKKVLLCALTVGMAACVPVQARVAKPKVAKKTATVVTIEKQEIKKRGSSRLLRNGAILVAGAVVCLLGYNYWLPEKQAAVPPAPAAPAKLADQGAASAAASANVEGSHDSVVGQDKPVEEQGQAANADANEATTSDNKTDKAHIETTSAE